MGCDIHSYSEKQIKGIWTDLDFSPFNWRSYGMYGFLAGVRNYSSTKPISEPRGVPHTSPVLKEYLDDVGYYHSASHLTVKELLEFDYEQPTEDRRCMRNNDGGCTCDEGEGEKMTYREFLGSNFFEDLQKLKSVGAERIVFMFDN